MQGRIIHNRINDGQLSQESLDGTWEWGRTTNDLKDDGDSHHTRASAAHPPNEDSTAETDESNHPIKPRIDAVYVFDYEETARDGLPISMVELTGTW